MIAAIRYARRMTKPASDTPPRTSEELLLEMLEHLRAMDRRDKRRFVNETIRSVLGLVPLLFFVVSAWYFYRHGDEIMRRITEEAVRQAGAYSQEESSKMMDQLQLLLTR